MVGRSTGTEFQVTVPSKSTPSSTVGGMKVGGVVGAWGMSSFTAWVWIGRVMIRSVRRTSITSISGVVFISTITSPSAVLVLIAMANYLNSCWLPEHAVR